MEISYSFNQASTYTSKKGQSLLLVPSDFTVVDLETTGLRPTSDRIIEVACIKYRDNVEVDRFTSFANPGKHINSFITKLTGITNDMVSDAPYFDEIADSVWDFLDGEQIVGHNVNFDINFLYDALLVTVDNKLSNDFVDSMRVARKVLPTLPHHTLSYLMDYFSIDVNHHRAADDCLSTVILLEKLNEIIELKGIKI